MFLAFLYCICESSIEVTSLNNASKDRFIPQLHNNIEFNILMFLEVPSFHARMCEYNFVEACEFSFNC